MFLFCTRFLLPSEPVCCEGAAFWNSLAGLAASRSPVLRHCSWPGQMMRRCARLGRLSTVQARCLPTELSRSSLSQRCWGLEVRGKRSTTRKKSDRDSAQRLSHAESSNLGEEHGVYRGQISALLGATMQVTLSDGRVVKAKPAGKLSRPGHFVTLKVGQAVSVQFDVTEDEDMQTPRIISRDANNDSAA